MAGKKQEIETLSAEGEQSLAGDSRTAGFVVVNLQASRTNRYVEADGFINGHLVCSASAADNYVTNVISSSKQSFTMPVPIGANWMIRWNVPNNQGEVKITRIPA